MNYLVLLRHGQSEWNLQNKFTGFHDVDLTEKGEAEAKKAGELIKASCHRSYDFTSGKDSQNIFNIAKSNCTLQFTLILSNTDLNWAQ